jgi:hypothetical protein
MQHRILPVTERQIMFATKRQLSMKAAGLKNITLGLIPADGIGLEVIAASISHSDGI